VEIEGGSREGWCPRSHDVRDSALVLRREPASSQSIVVLVPQSEIGRVHREHLRSLGVRVNYLAAGINLVDSVEELLIGKATE